IDNFDPFYPRQLKLLNTDGWDKYQNILVLDRDLTSLTVTELEKLLPQKVDVIIHLAAKAGVRPSIADPVAYQQTNVVGTQLLLDFARQTGVPQFVFASSSSVYGVNENLPWNEEEKLQPISPYAMTKLAGEMAGHVTSHLYGLRFVALRFFTVFGPGQRPDLAIHKFIKAVESGEPIPVYGDGSTSRDYTFVDDIIKGILAAISYSASPFEIINLGNHYSVSLNDLIATIEDVTGKKAVINRLPEQAGDVPHTYADISKAQRLLNYQPSTSLKEGIEKFYQWFLQHKEMLMT
ncbi:MAG TPA: NAD-dependent epimerase/dehydratase family protein, partial [Flavisolibacter sp.]|nr:NAD-dependent epimerase/dehydratase family protein [Flavisolibacter sp.]